VAEKPRRLPAELAAKLAELRPPAQAVAVPACA